MAINLELPLVMMGEHGLISDRQPETASLHSILQIM